MSNDKRFEIAWAKKIAKGYRYGDDALENVAFGFEIAFEELDTDLKELAARRAADLTADDAEALRWARDLVREIQGDAVDDERFEEAMDCETPLTVLNKLLAATERAP